MKDTKTVKRCGYLEFYLNLLFHDNTNAYVAYRGWFEDPNNIPSAMDDFIDLCKVFYKEKAGRVIVKYEYINKDEYDAHQTSVMLTLGCKNGEITTVRHDEKDKAREPWCDAPRDCGCTVWDAGKVDPGVCTRVACLHYHDGTEEDDD